MDIKEENTCRLCLANAEDSEYEIIDEIMRNMLEFLSLKLDLNLTENPVICLSCARITKSSYNFKSICINRFKTFSIVEKQEIKSELDDTQKGSNNTSVCQFCTNESVVTNFDQYLIVTDKAMVLETLPELELDVAKNFVVCTTCRDSLECYFNMGRKCSDTEEKINQYRKDKGVNDVGPVKLSDVMCFLRKDSLMQAIKLEPDTYTDIENERFKVYNVSVKTENSAIEDADLIEDVWDKDDSSPQSNIKIELYNCTACNFVTKHKNSLNKHRLLHKDPSEVKLHECAICNFTSRYKNSLNVHMLIHKDESELELYKCPTCNFETRYKKCLKNHSLVHKDAEEIEIHKCTLCVYETKRKVSLKRHMLTHIANVTTFKCTLCNFEARQKYYLKKHMLTHKDLSEVRTFKCTECPFETKYRESRMVHMRTHQNHLDVETYKCASCTYETRRKDGIRRHVKIHRRVLTGPVKTLE